MGKKTRGKGGRENDPGLDAFLSARAILSGHPVFSRLAARANISRSTLGNRNLILTLSPDGEIQINKERLIPAEELAFIICVALTHLGLGHVYGPNGRGEEKGEHPDHGLQIEAYRAAVCASAFRLVSGIKVGKPSDLLIPPTGTPEVTDEKKLVEYFLRNTGLLTEGVTHSSPHPWHLVRIASFSPRPDKSGKVSVKTSWLSRPETDWQKLMADALADGASRSLSFAAGRISSLVGFEKNLRTDAEIAREWFMANFPLIGSVAALLRIEERPEIIRSEDIRLAAVNPSQGVIYFNSAAGLSFDETLFVMAHEILHPALGHDERLEGRDPFLWNVACDFRINAWLKELRIGTMPEGVLYDEELAGLSAEAIYHRIVTDVRRFRRLATLRGVGAVDVLPPESGVRRANGDGADQQGTDLDRFYREALARGLDLEQSSGSQFRGLLPAGLIEEIRARILPPIAWDVRLANWFDERLPALEKARTYSRPSRRQGVSDDIPMPSYYIPKRMREARTFAVIIDSSGSMQREMLAMGLGAVSSYADSRHVSLVRVIFCDAAARDAGWMRPDELAGRVEVWGRGGTVLEPALRLLDSSEDFPQGGPVLIVTDGMIDRINPRRDHAFLMPRGAKLPFAPKGPVFYMEPPK